MRFLAAAATALVSVGIVVGAQAQMPSSNSAKPRITMKQARQTALTKEKGMIKSSELEKEHGRLIYSFDVRTADGIHEVNVDAMNGKVVEDSKESAADEAKEARQDKKADRAHKAIPGKQ
jgi:Peptidase propeptide and YPEB domain